MTQAPYHFLLFHQPIGSLHHLKYITWAMTFSPSKQAVVPVPVTPGDDPNHPFVSPVAPLGP